MFLPHGFLEKEGNVNFDERCYEFLRKVPKGKVTTYAELAKAIGSPKSSRAVGNAMNKNPFSPEVPCHRVVRSSGEAGGFAYGTKKKIEMLRKEGIEIVDGRVDLNKFRFKF